MDSLIVLVHVSMNLASLSASRCHGLLTHPETRPRTPINCGTPVQVYESCGK
jgi:hypothetical protein